MNIKLMRFFNKLVFTVLAMTLIFKVCVVNAQSNIVLGDGLGTGLNQNLNVPGAHQVITINGDGPNANGTQNGSNLFFSFKEFGIAAGDTALFQCPGGCAGVTNVISDVWGGNISVIDGSLVSIIGSANFWFFNPNGVNFNGVINIPLGATYHISNTNGITLNDTNFYFGGPSSTSSSLTSASPLSFLVSDSSSQFPLTIIEGTNINSEDTISNVAVKTITESVKPVIDIAQMNSSSLLPLPKSPCDNSSQSSLISKGVANYIPDLSSQVATSVLMARSSGISSSVEQAQYLKLAEEEGCQ